MARYIGNEKVGGSIHGRERLYLFLFFSSLVDVAVVWLRKDYTNLFAVNS
jgi:hypothetical protein